jgi:hypothetical protein
MGKAWIWAEDQGRQIQGNIGIVHTRSEATPMTNGNAQQIAHAAERGYPRYRWELIAANNNLFIVEGTEKSVK